MRLATIDVGTNTAQLLIAEIDGSTVRRRHVAERFVRLGAGVDARGFIQDAAIERLCRALEGHRTAARESDVDRIVVAGTSALRDATNRQQVLATVEAEVGLSIEILSGSEEADWSFAAACSAVDTLTGPCLVVDVGGGSTELVAGTDPTLHHPNYPRAITDRASLDVGCIRLTERCFATQPPTRESVRTATRIIEDTLATRSLALGPAPTVIGTAGTATALALVHTGPDSTWDALRGDGFVLHRADVRHWRDRLFRLTVDEILALHHEAIAGRADVFPVGVLLLDLILHHYNSDELQVSPYELRHGLALRALVGEG